MNQNHQDFGSGGILWPPIGLYEHFANCINNLACHNNSVIRAAMKSSGLFKIRDSLIEKLGQLDGPNMMSGGYYPHAAGQLQLQLQNQPQHPSPVLDTSGFTHNQYVYRPESSSSSSIVPEPDTGINGHAYGSANTYTNQDINANTNCITTKSNRARKRPSQRSGPTGLGLGMPSVM
ncbi:hypothetical protein BGZ65_003689 [Modicella reniformis]|uniref:Uncharacterized protein n=1 Tax=Modicella reniformis TaxID=1440133 RepID=A0A9P6IZR9_9FUNG|nr:hypothetical protein BGZ65_003689 [Modicella reniformis]